MQLTHRWRVVPPDRMRPLARLLIPVLALAAGPAVSDLAGLPVGARLAAEERAALASVSLPAGPMRSTDSEMLSLEGEMSRQAWQVSGSDLTTEQLLAPLRDGLAKEGFAIRADCADRACGGFEFRYALDLLPEPAMHVDLGDFRYVLMARGTGAQAEYVALLVSRTEERGFIHITWVGPSDPQAAGVKSLDNPAAGAPRARPHREYGALAAPSSNMPPPGDLADSLDRSGRAVLSDLTFETGSSRLAAKPFASLAALADWLTRHPGKTVVLVGHSDTEGALDSNIALSRKRAQAVGERLREEFGVDGSRVSAEGVGYLAPLASNRTDAGRSANRRVEVIVDGEG
ncbi:OmpA family protein [Tropicimonas sp. IMCC6043]|uniref:OmpA family protein n=1 Tax=Tropicimonas sp. IMCC6043 TaxID=2510645 RepID=UPI00101B92B1|nr:OmpA family protein [Tropicimonas sp. IMCC6043]RYH10965.1 OmpA family protein [Tropicimonas sp. IMCC6043]